MPQNTSRYFRWTATASVALSLVAPYVSAAEDKGLTFGPGGDTQRFLAIDNAITHLEDGEAHRRLQSE